MHCPEVIVFSGRWGDWTRYGRTDYKSRLAPLIERLNLFRYELLIRYPGGRIIINRDGIAWLRITNLLWRIQHLFCKHEWRYAAGNSWCYHCYKTNQSKVQDGQ